MIAMNKLQDLAESYRTLDDDLQEALGEIDKPSSGHSERPGTNESKATRLAEPGPSKPEPAISTIQKGSVLHNSDDDSSNDVSSSGNQPMDAGSWKDVSQPLTASPGRKRSRLASSKSDYHSSIATTGQAPLLPDAHYVKRPASNSVILMYQNEIEEAAQCASDLIKSYEDGDLLFSTQELLELCRTKQTKITSIMQNSISKIDDPAMDAPLNELMALNDTLLESIKFAENQMKQIASPIPISNSRSHLSLQTFATGSLEIDTLVNRKDVFSLICMLRAPGDKRLDSAVGLLR